MQFPPEFMPCRQSFSLASRTETCKVSFLRFLLPWARAGRTWLTSDSSRELPHRRDTTRETTGHTKHRPGSRATGTHIHRWESPSWENDFGQRTRHYRQNRANRSLGYTQQTCTQVLPERQVDVHNRGAWGAQLVEPPTSAQVVISRFVGSSPTSRSVLAAWGLPRRLSLKVNT